MEKYTWNHNVYKHLGVNTKTGKPLHHRKIKSFYGKKHREIQRIVHGLLLKPGDLVQTCQSYFNQKVQKIEHIRYCDWPISGNKIGVVDVWDKKYVTNIEFTTEDGYYHSWMDCCSLPLSVDKIVAYYKKYAEEFIKQDFENSFHHHWYPKEEAKEKWDAEFAWCSKIINRLKNGEEICDCFGVELPELRYEKNF